MYIAYCKQNCRTQAADGSCSSCHGGFEPPSCCNCPNGKTAIGGLCSELCEIIANNNKFYS